MSKDKKSVQQKVREEFPEFAEECQGLQVSALDSRLAQIAKDLEQVEDAKEADEELARLHAEATQAGAPYRESKKVLKLKTKYLISLIKEQE
jgi:hypothetical protein